MIYDLTYGKENVQRKRTDKTKDHTKDYKTITDKPQKRERLTQPFSWEKAELLHLKNRKQIFLKTSCISLRFFLSRP